MMFGSIIKNPRIAVPFLTIFVFNFNWQLIETGEYRLLLLLTIYYWSIVQLNSLSTHSSGTKCSGCFGFGKYGNADCWCAIFGSNVKLEYDVISEPGLYLNINSTLLCF